MYHASYTAIEKINLSFCADGKDFGKGFYVTTDYNQATKFVKTSIKKALKNGILLKKTNVGYISVFEFTKIDGVKYFEFVSADKNWLHCVAKHRNSTLLNLFGDDWNNYDVIAGKIANDTTNQVITTYVNGLYGELPSDFADETAIRLLLPNKLSDQICFRTENSLKCLNFINSVEVVVDAS